MTDYLPVRELIRDTIVLLEEAKENSVSTEYNKLRKEKEIEVEKAVCDSLSKKDLANLNFRKDRQRSYLSFFENIYNKTKEEQRTFEAWATDLRKRGHKVITKSTGADNTGLPVLSAYDIEDEGDFVASIDGQEYRLELKTSPTLACFTFKIANVERYIKKGINILLVMKDSGQYKYWQILDFELMQQLVDGDIGHRGMHFPSSRKPTVRVWKKQYEKMIEENNFSWYEFGNKKHRFV